MQSKSAVLCRRSEAVGAAFASEAGLWASAISNPSFKLTALTPARLLDSACALWRSAAA